MPDLFSRRAANASSAGRPQRFGVDQLATRAMLTALQMLRHRRGVKRIA